MRRALPLAGGALLLALLLSMGARGVWRHAGAPAAPDTVMVVPPGASSRAIARQLHGAGVLTSPRVFVWGLRLAGAADELRAGRYRFRRPSSPAQLARQLRAGSTEKVWLTLPEGLWLDEAVAQIAAQLELDSLDLAAAVRDPARWPSHDFLAGRPNLEGFLLPETYALEYPVTPDGVLRVLLDAFDRSVTLLRGQAPPGWTLDTLDWTTLASIVEAEAQLAEERPRIAAVYLNRLARGMKLEADPTVMYALGRRKPRLYFKDLAVDSPYNTYLNAGLPPGPICSPGRASLAAPLAADPADSSLYFVADGQGGHRFSATFAEHQRNVAALRRLQNGR